MWILKVPPLSNSLLPAYRTFKRLQPERFLKNQVAFGQSESEKLEKAEAVSGPVLLFLGVFGSLVSFSGGGEVSLVFF